MSYSIDVTMMDASEGFQIVKDGTHLVYVSNAHCKVSDSSGIPMVEIEFTVIGPNDPDKGLTIPFQYYSLSEKAIRRYVALAKAIDPKMPVHDASIQEDIDRLIYGQPLVIQTAQYDDTYNGETRKKVRIRKHAALNAAEEKALKEAYGDGLVPENGAARADAATEIPDRETLDDIPF